MIIKNPSGEGGNKVTQIGRRPRRTCRRGLKSALGMTQGGILKEAEEIRVAENAVEDAEERGAKPVVENA
jgi:hypothetical protein